MKSNSYKEKETDIDILKELEQDNLREQQSKSHNHLKMLGDDLNPEHSIDPTGGIYGLEHDEQHPNKKPS